ncbi:ligand-binding domain of nuclear hormone receptor domain-containing protein [Ditylenchus destructor]|nr:ligand-binding domain of nuclear hormone receptor domain-containing protein [Ditylenchus destructor]
MDAQTRCDRCNLYLPTTNPSGVQPILSQPKFRPGFARIGAVRTGRNYPGCPGPEQKKTWPYDTGVCLNCFLALITCAMCEKERIENRQPSITTEPVTTTSFTVYNWPAVPDCEYAVQTQLLLKTERRVKDFWRIGTMRDGYHLQNIGSIMSSGYYELDLRMPSEATQCVPVSRNDLKSTKMMNQATYLSLSLYLTMETAKTLECFRRLDVVDQIQRIALPVAHLHAGYFAKCSGKTEFVLPNNLNPMEILYPFENDLVNQVYEARNAVFSNFLTPLQSDLTDTEIVYLKSIMICYTGEESELPSLSDHAKSVLNKAGRRYFQILEDYLNREYGKAKATERLRNLGKVAVHFRNVAAKTRPLHRLILDLHGAQRYVSEFMNEIFFI